MSKGIVTDYPEICFICGRPSEAEHHLVFGTAGRELSEKDGLKVPVCNNCHNMGEILKRIHGNPMAERMSKIIGQLAWEKEYALQKADELFDKMEDCNTPFNVTMELAVGEARKEMAI